MSLPGNREILGSFFKKVKIFERKMGIFVNSWEKDAGIWQKMGDFVNSWEKDAGIWLKSGEIDQNLQNRLKKVKIRSKTAKSGEIG